MKRTLSLILAVAMVAVMSAVSLAASTTVTTADALRNAINGNTGTINVTLGSDIDLTSGAGLEIASGADVTINLGGGYTLTASNIMDVDGSGNASNPRNILVQAGGKLTVTGTGNIKCDNGDNEYGLINVYGEFTLESGNVESSDYAVVVRKNGVVNINGGKAAGGSVGISGNGGTKYAGDTTININGGEVTGDFAIYHPQKGTLNVYDGTITGATGIYLKGGSLNIYGGEINGTGEKEEYSFVSGGANSTGDAVIIENCNYPYPVDSVRISGGTITSDNASAVGSYAGSSDGSEIERLTGFITDGEFNSAEGETFDESLVAESKRDTIQNDNDGNVIVGAGVEGKKRSSDDDEPTSAEIERDRVVAALRAAADGDTVTLDVKKLSVISRFIADAVSGKNVNLEYDLDGTKVVVNGKNVPKTPPYRVWYSFEAFAEFK